MGSLILSYRGVWTSPSGGSATGQLLQLRAFLWARFSPPSRGGRNSPSILSSGQKKKESTLLILFTRAGGEGGAELAQQR